jgi:choline dehydrogenase-like flavoprotein/predicted dehydrogenase
MSIQDLRDSSETSAINADICIIGSGPAGLSLALQFAHTAIQVCILESGGLSEQADVDALSAIENIGMRRVEGTRRRGFGGTSSVWTGRCGVFDPIDYQSRAWVPFSGWPIAHDDVEPYLEQAARLLGLGPMLSTENWPEHLRRPSDQEPWDPRLLSPVVFQFSRSSFSNVEVERTFAEMNTAGGDNLGALQHAGVPKATHFGEDFKDVIEKSKNITVLLHANVTMIETSDDGTAVKSVTARSPSGAAVEIRAGTVVLACGGIDNARLLLASDRQNPGGVGNSRDVVGRFLTDHPLAIAGNYRGEGSRALRRKLGHRWLDDDTGRHVYQFGLRLSPELQRREQLLNCEFHIIEYGERQPAITVAGRVLRELKSRGPTSQTAVDMVEVLRNPLALSKGIYDRYVARQPTLTDPDTVSFCCVVEQQMDRDSRVRLSNERDSSGMRRALIDWRVADADFTTAKRGTEVLLREMTRLGFERPKTASWLEEGPSAYKALIHDMAHPMCATRMANNPSEGVVDANCQVHGVEGLFIAGGSVFSTPGYVNPTLMIVSLSLRLADHIKRTRFRRSSAPVTEAQLPTMLTEGSRMRVGFIGAGDRIKNVYLPILKALSDEFDIIGFTNRTPAKAESFSQETGLRAFTDARSLTETGKADFVVVAVASGAVDDALPALLGVGCPLLVETPICWNVRKGRKLLRTIAKSGTMVGVAEQTPFMPNERLKRKLIELGVIGRIAVAYNDFAAYDYHAIAALRAYAHPESRPVRVSAVTCEIPGPTVSDRTETWLTGTIGFNDGSQLIHQYSGDYFDSPLRGPKIMRIYGTSGSIIDDEVRAEFGHGDTAVGRIERQELDGRLQKLTVSTPIGEIEWINPFAAYDFSDEQIGVATLLRSMAITARNGGVPIYSAKRALGDMEIMAALQISARVGRHVSMPIRLPTIINDAVRKRFLKGHKRG